jgi:hypothetical protein
MNGFGGTIDHVHRGLGVAIIKKDGSFDEFVVFTKDVLKGGDHAFQNIQQGDRVRFAEYPSSIVSSTFAEDVWPDTPP